MIQYLRHTGKSFRCHLLWNSFLHNTIEFFLFPVYKKCRKFRKIFHMRRIYKYAICMRSSCQPVSPLLPITRLNKILRLMILLKLWFQIVRHGKRSKHWEIVQKIRLGCKFSVIMRLLYLCGLLTYAEVEGWKTGAACIAKTTGQAKLKRLYVKKSMWDDVLWCSLFLWTIILNYAIISNKI